MCKPLQATYCQKPLSICFLMSMKKLVYVNHTESYMPTNLKVSNRMEQLKNLKSQKVLKIKVCIYADVQQGLCVPNKLSIFFLLNYAKQIISQN